MSGRPDRDSMIHTYAIRILKTAIAFLALLMVSSVAQAQVLYGSLTGTVTDKAGAVIPNVAVTIANQQTGDLRTAKVNGEGIYNFLDVLPGTARPIEPGLTGITLAFEPSTRLHSVWPNTSLIGSLSTSALHSRSSLPTGSPPE